MCFISLVTFSHVSSQLKHLTKKFYNFQKLRNKPDSHNTTADRVIDFNSSTRALLTLHLLSCRWFSMSHALIHPSEWVGRQWTDDGWEKFHNISFSTANKNNYVMSTLKKNCSASKLCLALNNNVFFPFHIEALSLLLLSFSIKSFFFWFYNLF